MSRNENRTGFPEDFTPQDDTPTPAVAATVGTGAPQAQPTFSWSVPTEFVTLPSGGRFYPQGHPLHNRDTVEIKYMTAKEEDILTSRALLKEGLALDRMLQSLLVEEGVRIDSLLVGDKNALLIAARRTGYGPEYITSVSCPACNTSEQFEFDISEPKTNNFEQNIEDDPSVLIKNNNVLVTLPMTKATVECRMLTGADETRLLKEATRKAKRKAEERTMTDLFRSYIVSVNGESSPLVIEGFIQALPARDARVLRAAYSSCVPNVDLTQLYDCPNCGHIADMEVPLTSDFFWPK
jgi:hypothetical protein